MFPNSGIFQVPQEYFNESFWRWVFFFHGSWTSHGCEIWGRNDTFQIWSFFYGYLPNAPGIDDTSSHFSIFICFLGEFQWWLYGAANAIESDRNLPLLVPSHWGHKWFKNNVLTIVFITLHFHIYKASFCCSGRESFLCQFLIWIRCPDTCRGYL